MRVALLILSGVVAASGLPQGPAADPRDAGVYQAILDTTILPEVNRSTTRGGLPPEPVVTFDRSLSLCRAPADRALLGCVDDQNVVEYFAREAATRPPVIFPALSPGLRAELAVTFRQRNATSQPLMGSALTGVTMVTPEALASARTRPGSILGFSLPAYSNDGHALVYAHSMCVRCGRGWLFLLQQGAESWNVLGVEQLWVS